MLVTLPKRTALAGAFGVCVGLLVCAIAASVSQLQHRWRIRAIALSRLFPPRRVHRHNRPRALGRRPRKKREIEV